MKHDEQEIVYIEYQDGKPHSVSTAELDKWSLQNFDFEIDCYDDNSFMHYNSGAGGYATEIQAPTYVDGCEATCSYWLHPKAKLKGAPKNITQIKDPIEINGSTNPFENSREVFDLIYCKYCDKYLDEDWCDHLDNNDEGNIVYQNGELHDSMT